MRKFSSRLWIIALVVAWGFDFLFWQKIPGISFTIFTALCVLGGLILTWGEGLRPAVASLPILLPWAFFAAMSFIRQEPFTLSLNYLLTLMLMAILAHTLLGGRWIFYGVADYVVGLFQLAGSVLSKGLLQGVQSRTPAENGVSATPNRPSFWKRSLPVIRGLLLAIPVLGVFAVLLASADPIFSKRLTDVFSFLRIEKLPEYVWRFSYIMILAYLLVGVYLHSLTRSREEKLLSQDKPLLAPFLGLTESAIILGGLDLLFAFFVAIQFRYFFGGNANISLEGYTYSEYARRGFGELLAVAFFSLLLFLGLGNISRRKEPLQRRIFSGLGIALVILVSIILVSAFQRLMLYEQVYGFSRLRAYTHVLIIWIGVLLLAVVFLELFGKLRFFALAALLAVLGFGVSLNLMNVDSYIVRQNVNRAVAGEEFDAQYLNTLSPDAVPELVSLYASPSLPENIHANLGGILACQAALLQDESRWLSWQSFHLARYRAQQLLLAYQGELSTYQARHLEQGGWGVTVQGKEMSCYNLQGD